MSSTLSMKNALLTIAVNRLRNLLQNKENSATTELRSPAEEAEEQQQIKSTKKVSDVIESGIRSVKEALEEYTTTADRLDAKKASTVEIRQRVDSDVKSAIELIDEAANYLTQLSQRRDELEEVETNTIKASQAAPMAHLPPVPIPKFSGQIWEWETFWGAFNYSVHQRHMDDFLKMNYLLDALQGEARETVKQYEISQETYKMVIQHLKEKYGNRQALINQLLNRLRNAQAQSKRLEDQEILRESLYSIVTQLRQKGENVDNTFLQQELLQKFTKDIQRYVLQQKRQQGAGALWRTDDLLQSIKQYINEERELRIQLGKAPDHWKRANDNFSGAPISHKPTNQPEPHRGRGCFYCERTNHAPNDCMKVRTLEERLNILRKRNLCLNCGSRNHQTSDCKGGSCQICNKYGHHTSICRKQEYPKDHQSPHKGHKKGQQHSSRQDNTKRERGTVSSRVKAVLAEHEQSPDAIVLHIRRRHAANVQILAGEALVLNPSTQTLEPVHVMLDTGSDRSFITNELAERLQLRNTDATELAIHTFANHKPIKRNCGITKLKL